MHCDVHCNDEELLAHLDGELRFFQRGRVRRHLESCWVCRTRAAVFEKQIQQLTGRADSWRYPSPEWIAESKSELGRRMLHFEVTRPSEPGHHAWRRSLWISCAAAFAMVGVMATFILLPGKKSSEQIQPRDVVARVKAAEHKLFLQPVEQVFAIQIVQTSPFTSSSKGKLQVWSDRATNRFASKWIGSRGDLKQALWQPSADAEFFYNPSTAKVEPLRIVHSQKEKPLLSLVDHGFESDKLEQGFMQWMESRSWTPIAFTPELSVWTEKDGAVASVETISDRDGSRLIRVTARKQNNSLTATLTVEVDPRTWWPKRQTIRFESAGRIVEFRLTSDRVQPMTSSQMSPAVFHPDIPSAADLRVRTSVPPTFELPVEAADSSRFAAERAMQAVEAHYILHEVGACLGEPVKIEEEPGGIRVWNLGGASGSWPQTFTTEATLRDVTGALADLRRAPQRMHVDERDARVPDSALRNARALRDLIMDFPADRVGGLPERSWHLLESMLHAHMSALRHDLISSDPSDRGISRALPSTVPNWRASAEEIVALLLRIRDEPNSIPAAFDELGVKMDEIAVGFAAESTASQKLYGRNNP